MWFSVGAGREHPPGASYSYGKTTRDEAADLAKKQGSFLSRYLYVRYSGSANG
jgi:hypothetical protein